MYVDDCNDFLPPPSPPIDDAVPVGNGQGHEGCLQGNVTDECQNEPTTAAEDHDGV